MSNTLILQSAIEKLDKIDYTFVVKEGYSSVVLFKEFLRRLSNVYLLSKSKSNFSVNFYLTLVKHPIEGLDEQINQLIGQRSFRNFGNGGALLAHTFLYWEVYKHHLPFELSFELLNLYEPLLRVFERGGYITRESGVFDVCHIEGFYLKTLRASDTAFIEDFSDENLDRIDALGHL